MRPEACNSGTSSGTIWCKEKLGGAQKYIWFAEDNLKERAQKGPVWRGPWWMIPGLDPAQALVLAQIDLHNRCGYTQDRQFVPVDRETIR
jgi:hypothetical protein